MSRMLAVSAKILLIAIILGQAQMEGVTFYLARSKKAMAHKAKSKNL